MTDDEEVGLDTIQELWQLESARLADRVVRNVTIGLNKFLERILILSCTIVDRVVMENKCTLVLDTEFR